MSQAATTVLPNAVAAASTPGAMNAQGICSGFVLRMQLTLKRDRPRLTWLSLVVEDALDAPRSQHRFHILQATTRQAQMLRMIFRASDDARLSTIFRSGDA